VTIAFTKGKHPFYSPLGYLIDYKRATGTKQTAVRKKQKRDGSIKIFSRS
jgi:hypothetical protein